MRLAFVAGMTALLMLFGTPLCAYVLRGPHILDEVIRQYGRARSALVQQTVLFYSADGLQPAARVKETLRYRFPDRFRSEAVARGAERIHVRSGGAALTIVDGSVSQTPETYFDLYKDVLLLRSRTALIQRLNDLGLRTDISRYDRFKGKIAYVIGARRSNDRLPQLWVDKDTFTLIRWCVPVTDADNQPAVLDIRYDAWRRVDMLWYPMRIVFYLHDRPVREIQVNRLSIDPSFSDDLFDIDRLRMSYSFESGAGRAPDVDTELENIRRTIDEFRQKFE